MCVVLNAQIEYVQFSSGGECSVTIILMILDHNPPAGTIISSEFTSYIQSFPLLLRIYSSAHLQTSLIADLFSGASKRPKAVPAAAPTAAAKTIFIVLFICYDSKTNVDIIRVLYNDLHQ